MEFALVKKMEGKTQEGRGGSNMGGGGELRGKFLLEGTDKGHPRGEGSKRPQVGKVRK